MTRTTLITGATGTIGAATAVALAARGDDLVLVARDPDAADELAAAIAARHTRRPHVEIADLSLVADTIGLAARLIERGRPLHALVHAAGVMTPRREITREGHELVMMLQFTSRWLLTEQLRPVLGLDGPSRVVTVSGGARTMRRFDPANLDAGHYRAMTRLAESGHANAVWTHHQNTFAVDDRYDLVDLHPGLVRSRLADGMPAAFRAVMGTAIPVIGTDVERAAAGIAAATTDDVPAGFVDSKGRIRTITGAATEPATWRALQARLATLIAPQLTSA